MELSIVMPCRDEAETLEHCVAKARRYLDTASVDGEIMVVDNGSTDGSGAWRDGSASEWSRSPTRATARRSSAGSWPPGARSS